MDSENFHHIQNQLLRAIEALEADNESDYHKINKQLIVEYASNNEVLANLLLHFQSFNDLSNQSYCAFYLLINHDILEIELVKNFFRYHKVSDDSTKNKFVNSIVKIKDESLISDFAAQMISQNHFSFSEQLLLTYIKQHSSNSKKLTNLLIRSRIYQKKKKQALDTITKALADFPNDFVINYNCGLFFEELGDKSNAIKQYQHCLSIEPKNALTVARLLELKANHSDELLETANELLSSRITKQEKQTLQFAIAFELDRQGFYEQAFNFYKAANDSIQTDYDANYFDVLVEKIKNHSSVVKTANNATPIFICGMFRSGSTLIEQILSAHSKIRNAGEVSFFSNIIKLEENDEKYLSTLIDKSQLNELAKEYSTHMTKEFGNINHTTNKHLHNYLYIDLIISLFPNAKIVVTKRNKLTNILSIYFQHMNNALPYASDLKAIAHQYDIQQKLVTHFSRKYPNNIQIVEYESLVADFQKNVGSLLEFLGLDYERQMCQFYKSDNLVSTASVWQVRQPIYTSSVDRFSNYKDYVDI